jgi:hypothetical protein
MSDPAPSIDEKRQVDLLTRTFFTRLFESDLMPPGLPQVRLVISVVAAITMILTLLPVMLRLHASRFAAFQYTIAMIALAFVALVIWEGIFPDHRDSRILSPLPIRARTFVVARLAALAAFFGLFAVGSTVLPSFAFTTVGNPVAHFVALVALDAFAFFSIVAVQCVLLNVFGRIVAQRLALVLQVLIVVVLIQVPVLPANHRGPGAAAEGPAWWLPSFWFVGLYEVLSGSGDATARPLASLAAVSAVGLPLLTVLLYAGTYRRLLRRAIEGDSPPANPRSSFESARALVRRIVVFAVPNPVARSVCLFTLKTMARSRRHKMLLAMYLGVAAALILSVVVPRALLRGFAGFATPDAALLSLPLVLMFMALVAVRSLIRIPVEIAASWIFRLREPVARGAAVGGVAWAMALGGVLPVTLLAGASAWLLWGPAVGTRHAAYIAALGLLLTHALLITFNRFPFVCPYVPGSSRIRMLWPLYLTFFSTYSYTMGRIEVRLLRNDAHMLVAIAIVLAIAGALVVARRLLLRHWIGFAFEVPDSNAMFEGFRLSEQLAAERARGRAAYRA